GIRLRRLLPRAGAAAQHGKDQRSNKEIPYLSPACHRVHFAVPRGGIRREVRETGDSGSQLKSANYTSGGLRLTRFQSRHRKKHPSGSERESGYTIAHHEKTSFTCGHSGPYWLMIASVRA